jgi:hypothetical protein
MLYSAAGLVSYVTLKLLYIYVHTLCMQVLPVYFPLKVKNKPYDGVANCGYILELGVITHNTHH